MALDEQTGGQLLNLARTSLVNFVRRREIHQPRWDELPEVLQQQGSTFVTLMNQGRLRGCIGSTRAELPLAYDVVRNAAAAACDPRFTPISLRELEMVRLEVSVLEEPRLLAYKDQQDLWRKLRPGVDGVIISWQGRRALLLPQVWTRVSDPGDFLQVLCQKAEIPEQEIAVVPPTVKVMIFQANAFEEDGYYVET